MEKTMASAWVLALGTYAAPVYGQVISTVAGTNWFFPTSSALALSAPLGESRGVAIDALGNVYSADSGNNIVVRVSSRGALTVVAGNGSEGYSGDGGPATSASLDTPNGVSVDSAGNLYIADMSNSRIRKVSGGTITTVAGNGTHGFSGDGGPATSASLWNPSGVAVDSAGNLYIADTDNKRIRKVSGGMITTVAGGGADGFLGDGGPATSASLAFPSGVAVDSAGNLYIADWGIPGSGRCLRERSQLSPGTGMRVSQVTGGPPLVRRSHFPTEWP
jgi:sugar lactone lactonase YvrE